MDSAPIAQFYRDQAARLVRLAATSKFADVRDQLTQIARQYEALARRSASRDALALVAGGEARS